MIFIVLSLPACCNKIIPSSKIPTPENWNNPAYKDMEEGFYGCNFYECSISRNDVDILITNQAMCEHIRRELIKLIKATNESR